MTLRVAPLGGKTNKTKFYIFKYLVVILVVHEMIILYTVNVDILRV